MLTDSVGGLCRFQRERFFSGGGVAVAGDGGGGVLRRPHGGVLQRFPGVPGGPARAAVRADGTDLPSWLVASDMTRQ